MQGTRGSRRKEEVDEEAEEKQRSKEGQRNKGQKEKRTVREKRSAGRKERREQKERGKPRPTWGWEVALLPSTLKSDGGDGSMRQENGELASRKEERSRKDQDLHLDDGELLFADVEIHVCERRIRSAELHTKLLTQIPEEMMTMRMTRMTRKKEEKRMESINQSINQSIKQASNSSIHQSIQFNSIQFN